MYVSALSLGARGWVQILAFVIFGALLLVFARGVAKTMGPGPASRAGPVLLAVIAVCILASGPFVMDPMNTLRESMSAHGMTHQVLGAIVFSLMPVACFVFFRRFRAERAWQWFQWWTLACGTIIVAAVVLLKVAQLGLPPQAPNELTRWIGLIQRCALVPFLAWVFTFALALERRSRA